MGLLPAWAARDLAGFGAGVLALFDDPDAVDEDPADAGQTDDLGAEGLFQESERRVCACARDWRAADAPAGKI